MRRLSNSRLAFTLVELLIVMAILALLLALLLPAVQRVRESANRTACKGRMNQIGIALQAYHGEQGVFPASYLIQYGGGGVHGEPDPETFDAGPGFAWGTMLLPYLDLETLYQDINTDLPCWHHANQTACSRRIGAYLCPSDRVSETRGLPIIDEDGNLLADWEFGSSSYVASAGRDEPWGYPIPGDVSEIADGAMFRNARLSAVDFLDGLSKTVFLGEHHGVLSRKTWVGVVPGAAVCPGLQFAWSEEGCDEAATLVNVHSGPAPGETPPIIHAPNNFMAHVCGMYSSHSGGCNVLFGDGSVHFIAETISHEVWAALATRAGDEVIGEDF